MSIENQCKQMDIVIKRLKDMDLYVLSDVVDYAKGKLISLSAELEGYQKATELSGKVNSKLIQELMENQVVCIPDVDWLAAVIRKVNGNNLLGAGAMAEKIVDELLASDPSHSKQSANELSSKELLKMIDDLRGEFAKPPHLATTDTIKGCLHSLDVLRGYVTVRCPRHESDQDKNINHNQTK